jgi:helicase
LLFKELNISDQVKKVLNSSGLTELFPPQEEAIKAGALKGKNLLLASPTASGKTLIAELSALKKVLEEDGKVLYLSPLRALASEKYAEFNKYTTIKKSNKKRIQVGISTGDFDSNDHWLGRYDIIITTNEKCDSLLRHRAKWINEISVVIADEVHLLNDPDRGPTLEVVLARLLEVNPELQVLALSATVRNVKEIAEWLSAIPITTNWRPIPLREGVLKGTEIQFKDGGSTKIKNYTNNSSINLALNNIEIGGQVLIFASTRRQAVNLSKKAGLKIYDTLSEDDRDSLIRIARSISSRGEQTRISRLLADLIKQGVAFHHAGLAPIQRKIIEDSFRNGNIKVIAATPTLAFGVNLPARMVIINSYKRYEPGYGYYPIRVLEYKQMIGRAGRPKYDKNGESILIAKNEEERNFLFSSFVLAEPERIWSKLGVEKILRSHVLATIASDFAHSEESLLEFFKRTLYSFQYDIRGIKEVIGNILKFLYREEMLIVSDGNLHATRFGRRVSQLYIDPLSAIIIRDGLHYRALKLTNFSFLHLVSHTPDMFPKIRCTSREIDKVNLFLEKHDKEIMFEIPNELVNPIRYEEFLGEVKAAWILESWISELSEDEIIESFGTQPGDVYRLISTAKWLLYASFEIAKMLGYKDILPRISQLQKRVEKGIMFELIPLTELEGVGRVRARVMYDAGFKTIEDLYNIPLSELTRLPLIGPTVGKRIKEQVNDLIIEKRTDEDILEK